MLGTNSVEHHYNRLGETNSLNMCHTLSNALE